MNCNANATSTRAPIGGRLLVCSAVQRMLSRHGFSRTGAGVHDPGEGDAASP